MGKAWNRISGFFSGGRTPKPPTAAQLYSGPQASWGASVGADGTFSGQTTTQTVQNPAYSSNAVRLAQARVDSARLTGRGMEAAQEALRAAQAVPRTIEQTSTGYVPASAQVRGNERGTQAAMRALANTERIANVGWTSQDRAAFGAADRASQRSAQAAIGALAQQARARGTFGSGVNFAASAGAAQQATNAAADRGASIAQAGADRRAQASQALAGMGMGIDQQQFGQGMARAGAVDAFNQYATGARAGALQQSYDNRRQYESDEAARRQRVFDQVMQIGSAAGGMFGGE